MLFWFLAAAVAAAPAAAVPAAPSAAVAPADAGRMAEAVRMLDAQGFEEQTREASELTMEALLVGITEMVQKQMNGEAPAELLATLKQTIRNHNSAMMSANMTALKQQAAALYAAEFTADELARVRGLLLDPVLVKMREREKRIAPKLMMLGMEQARNAQPELDAKLKRAVEDYVAKQPQGTVDRS
jgi:predicted N-acetyltransferase YhbS